MLTTWEEINRLRELLAHSNRELLIAGGIIRELRAEKAAAEYEQSELREKVSKLRKMLGDNNRRGNCRRSGKFVQLHPINYHSWDSLSREEILRSVEVEAIEAYGLSEAAIELAIDLSGLGPDEMTGPIGRVRGFPYRRVQKPGRWSVRGLNEPVSAN